METAHDMATTSNPESLFDDYDERPIEGVLELEELVQLRSELSWPDWKAHPRFKKDRMIREAQRRLGVRGDAPTVPMATPANDVRDGRFVEELELAEQTDALARDADFAVFCDERRDAWLDTLEALDGHHGDD